MKKTRYSFSRDAIKAIRPKKWAFDIQTCNYDGPASWRCIAERFDKKVHLSSGVILSEELAELHAIIQAVEYERRNS
jgi:hypothetical protein